MSTEAPPAPSTAVDDPPKRRRVLGLLDITLFTVSAMLVVDQLTASASIGSKTIGWWLLCIVLFLVPYGLIASELATTYPGQGGIYLWVKRAFGARWAARTTYWYWINVALWMPAVFLLFAGVFSQLFASGWTDWASGKWPQVAIAVLLTWLVVAVGVMRLEVGKWVNNLGAGLKMAIILAIAVGGVVVAIKDGAANSIDAGSLVPSFHVATDFLPVIVYMLMGFELVSSMGDEIKQPEKQIPRAFFASGLITAGLYLFATVGILLALSLNDLSLVGGLVDTFKAIFGTSAAGDVVVYALGIAALYTFFTNMTTWSMGSNRAAAEAAADGELPAFLAREHPVRRTPVAAFLVTGIVSTAVLLVTAVFIDTQDSLFYAIFAASSVVFLLPYLLMFPAVLRLRLIDPDRPRPFRIPGGTPVVAALSAITSLFVAATALLFVWPEIPGRPADWGYTGPLLGIVVAALVAGEIILWRQLRRHHPRSRRPVAVDGGGTRVATGGSR
jgi:amino acid transporter